MGRVGTPPREKGAVQIAAKIGSKTLVSGLDVEESS